MVRAVPDRDRVTRGQLPAGSDVAWTLSEDPRWHGAGDQDVPRQPRNPGGGGPRRRPDGVLAEMVLSDRRPSPVHQPPRQLATGGQTPKHQPFLTGRRPDRGAPLGTGPRAAVQ